MSGCCQRISASTDDHPPVTVSTCGWNSISNSVLSTAGVQVAEQAEPHHGVLVDLRPVDLDLTPVGLGQVERDVRPLQQVSMLSPCSG